MNIDKSYMGYRKGSPYEDDPFIDIFSPDGIIDMSDTRKDLLGIDNLGNRKIMKGGRREPYYFNGNIVREIPLDQMAKGGLTAAKAKEMLRDGTAQGHKLTNKQKRYFRAISHGWKPKRQEGGEMENPYAQQWLDFLFEEDQPIVQQEQIAEESPEIDLAEFEREKQKIKEEQEYNMALAIAMQGTDNPYEMNFDQQRGLNLNNFTKEKIDNKASYTYNFLLRKGYSPQVASGIAANIKHESNFDPSAIGDKGKARGIAQWHPDRYSRLSKQFDLNSLSGNLEALHYELQTSEKDAYSKIKNARTPEEAALLVDRYFERSAGLSTGKRMNTAKNIYNTFTND